ncbi:MAG: tetratricopeptide repeat protein [Deltaproteobacteria bacterium]|nr:tetratricopeptide repeat protein [Deltaproteobacteria bacterium]
MNRLEKLLEQMVGAIQKGRPQIALSLASSFTDLPCPPSLLHLKGLAHAMLEEISEALVELEKAHDEAPQELSYILDFAKVLERSNDHTRAATVWERALTLCDNDIGLWHHLAQSQIASENFRAAADSYRRALLLEPEHFSLWCNLAGTLKRGGEFDEAQLAWTKAMALEPESAIVLAGLGSLKVEQADFDAARHLLERAVRLEPEALEPRVNLILVAMGQGQLAEAKGMFMSQSESWRTSSKGIEVHASILDYQSRESLLNSNFDEAAEFAREALAKNPELGSAWFNLGQVLRVHGDWEDAIEAYNRSSECSVDDISGQVAAWLTLPILYNSQAEIEQARAHYSSGLDALLKSYKVDDLRDLTPALQVASHRSNFQLAYQQKDDVTLQKKYGQWVSDVFLRHFGEMKPRREPPNKRIRVGFISSYWWRHTIGKLFRGWVEELESDEFEIIVYHLGTRQDEVTQSLALAADTYVNIQGLDAQVKRIKEDAVDVLIYPEVGMDGGTLALAAQRLAPVQCVAWGHPITTGLPTMDYFLTSEAMEPDESATAYSEQLIKLPGLSIAYNRPVLPKLVRSREDFKLPQEKVLYLCCQSLFKYLPENDEVWVNIRRQVPDAHFVFIHNKSSKITERFKNRLATQFQNSGVTLNDCVSFVGQLAFEDYLQLNGVCDVYLDSLGWSGGNTSLEALAWGLPMVTLAGTWMRGRHTSAILNQMNMGEWVASDREGYVERAILLGQDAERRRAVRELLGERSELVYGDTEPVRALESFLRKVSTCK